MTFGPPSSETGDARRGILGLDILVLDDRRALRQFDGIGAGDTNDRAIGADLRDDVRERGDGVLEAEIVVGENKDEFAFGDLEDLGDIFVNELHGSAMMMLELSRLNCGKQRALFRVAGIVANNDFDVWARPGTGLAILAQARRSCRCVGSKIESCTDLTAR